MAFRETPDLVLHNATVVGWSCRQCESYNDILTRQCRSCNNSSRLEAYDSLEAATVFNRGLIGLAYIMPDKDDARELHSKFFNAERVFVKDMDNAQLREHRLTLQSIAFEARSRLTAIDAEERERDANGKRDRNWLVSSGNDPNVTDAIDAVKIRKERMSKADKMAESFKSLGLPPEQVAALMANVAKVTDSSSKSSSTSTLLKVPAVSFNKVQGTTHNTTESLLGDISTSLVEGIKSERPIDDLTSAARTAGHLANKVLNKTDVSLGDVSLDNLSSVQSSEPFDPSKLFG